LDNLSWGHLLVLGAAAMFILGPERLPEAATWLARTITQLRDFAADARARLQKEIGPELDQLRQPLEQLREPLRELRQLDPRRGVVNTLYDNPPLTPATPPTTPARPLAPGERPPIDPDAT
jgi:sec-independent protein translocase protein TatB